MSNMNVFEPGQTKYSIEVMQAYVDGKTIQGCIPKSHDVTWSDVEFPTWDWSTYKYRVKPESLTCWVTVIDEEVSTVHSTKERALKCIRIGVDGDHQHFWKVVKFRQVMEDE